MGVTTSIFDLMTRFRFEANRDEFHLMAILPSSDRRFFSISTVGIFFFVPLDDLGVP